jgi:type I restriction enzyme, S subunit
VVGRKGSLGKVAYSDSPCWPIDTTYYVDATATGADLRWLAYRLDGMGLTELNRAAAVPGLNREDAYRKQLLLPSIEEQRRIAAILVQAEALRVKRRRAIAYLDDLVTSLYVEMFERHADRGLWPTEALERVVRKGTLVTYGIVQAGREFPGGVPYIRTGDIQNGLIRETQLRHADPEIAARFERSRVRAGELVMSIRATVGTTAAVPASLEGANLTQGTARISPGEAVHSSFLLHQLRSDVAQQWIKRQVKGATFREITLARLRQLPILVPPSSLQLEYAERVSSICQLRDSYSQHEAGLESLFASLQHRAFKDGL